MNDSVSGSLHLGEDHLCSLSVYPPPSFSGVLSAAAAPALNPDTESNVEAVTRSGKDTRAYDKFMAEMEGLL